MSTELVKKATMRDLVDAYQKAAADVRAAFELIAGAQKLVDSTFNLAGHGNITIAPRGEMTCSATFDLDKCLRRMKRDAWRFIVERLEIRRVLSVAKAEALQKTLESDELPEVTLENVEAFRASFVGSMAELLDEAIAEVFGFLRPRENTRAAKLKTNDLVQIGEKAILVRAVELGWDGLFNVRGDGTRQELRALENVFSALDGRGQIGKHYQSRLQDAIEARKSGEGETEYFAFKACKNGNLHLRFKRLDLVAEQNRRAGGKNLRPVKPGRSSAA